jgi:hypothetical protein
LPLNCVDELLAKSGKLSFDDAAVGDGDRLGAPSKGKNEKERNGGMKSECLVANASKNSAAGKEQRNGE